MHHKSMHHKEIDTQKDIQKIPTKILTPLLPLSAQLHCDLFPSTNTHLSSSNKHKNPQNPHEKLSKNSPQLSILIFPPYAAPLLHPTIPATIPRPDSTSTPPFLHLRAITQKLSSITTESLRIPPSPGSNPNLPLFSLYRPSDPSHCTQTQVQPRSSRGPDFQYKAHHHSTPNATSISTGAPKPPHLPITMSLQLDHYSKTPTEPSRPPSTTTTQGRSHLPKPSLMLGPRLNKFHTLDLSLC